ncbi:hypothetical protein ASG87_05960 [Frateuria sp. Soil773]|uniref:hypothetical protein n=1 Tax=Frateuria sp. Soil773 TaxID=1736407 RepID=UPI000700ECBD|nr:hypothetical protein [Frateuria sp. Soil773]KRE89087.1 hypothetical protein ASG87_05960 [Frateuria sp. Soil773]
MLIVWRGLAIAVLGILSSAASAQDATGGEWTFRIAPYLWGTAIDGNVAHARLPVDLHAGMSFGDVWDNLDLGAMGAFEARKGRYGVLADGMFANLFTTVYAPIAGASLPVRLKTRTATGLLAFQYGWIESDAGYLDLVAGVRVWSARTRLAYSIPVPVPPPVPRQYSGSQQERWVDLQVGVKGRRMFPNGMFVGGWALAGSGESDLSTDVMLMAGYGVNDRLSVMAGYRWLSTDFRTSNGFKFDTTLQGPGIGLEYRF